MMTHETTATGTAVLPVPDKVQHRRHATGLLLACLAGDAVVIFASLAFSSWLRFETRLAQFGTSGSIVWREYIGHVVLGTLLFLALLPRQEIYDLHRMIRFRATLWSMLRASAIWLVAY